ncbi:hypothetical protein [Noviherbaspirillum malthae]|uniref:hypothetical protein n=1 Tax=Noviherbaspirillum malthae TaxID=1260987 RepID=UPI00188ECFEA|nr:hypothetical protein [Noviherbaspirillum malthae]
MAIEADIATIKALHQQGVRCMHTAQLNKYARQRLVQHNYLIEVIKGWYVIHLDHYREFTEEDWHHVYEHFVSFYCNQFFAGEWHLSQECSLLRHIGELDVPEHLTVHAPLATNTSRELLFGCQLHTMRTTFSGNGHYLPTRNGIQVMSLAQSIIRVPPAWVLEHQAAYKKALSLITNVDDLLEPLLDANRTTVAGRIASALRQTGRKQEAKMIRNTVRQSNLRFRGTNPFSSK